MVIQPASVIRKINTHDGSRNSKQNISTAELCGQSDSKRRLHMRLYEECCNPVKM